MNPSVEELCARIRAALEKGEHFQHLWNQTYNALEKEKKRAELMEAEAARNARKVIELLEQEASKKPRFESFGTCAVRPDKEEQTESEKLKLLEGRVTHLCLKLDEAHGNLRETQEKLAEARKNTQTVLQLAEKMEELLKLSALPMDWPSSPLALQLRSLKQEFAATKAALQGDSHE